MPYIQTYYGLYFSGSGGVVRLPINPEKLPITWDNDNKEENVLGIGPIMIPRTPKLREVSVSSFFPGLGGEVSPETYINFFSSAMANKEVIVFTPVRFYEDGTPFATSDVGFECLVTEFVYEERGGETGDFYYDLTCTEYRDYTPQRMQIATSGASTGSGASSASLAAFNRSRASTSAVTTPTTQMALRLTAAPSRKIAQGQIYAGALAVANGTVYETSQRGGVSSPVSGQRCIIQRIQITDPSGVYIITENGDAIGWIAPDALQVVSTTQ